MRLHLAMQRAASTAPASAACTLILTALVAACSDVAGPAARVRRPDGPAVALDSGAGVDAGLITPQKAPAVPGTTPPGTGPGAYRPPLCATVVCPPPPSMQWSYQVDNKPYVSVPKGAPTPVVSASHALAIRIDAKQFKGLTLLDGYTTVDGTCVAHLPVLHRTLVAPYTDDFADDSGMEGGGPLKYLIIRFDAGKLLGAECTVPYRGTALKGAPAPAKLRFTLHYSTAEEPWDFDNTEIEHLDVKLTP